MKSKKPLSVLVIVIISLLFVFSPSPALYLPGLSTFTHAQTTDWDQIRAVAWHPNGTIFAIGALNGVWVYDTGFNLVAGLSMPSDFLVDGLAFSPDGSSLAAVTLELSPTGTIIWNTATWQAFTSPLGCCWVEGGGYVSFDWSPDSTKLVMPSDERVFVVNGSTGENIFGFHAHHWGATAVDWSPDGTKIASVGKDQTLRISDASNGAEIKIIQASPPDESPPLKVVWNADGSRLATTVLWAIDIWDLETEQSFVLFGPTSYAPIELIWNGDYLISLGHPQENNDLPIWIWDTETGEAIGFAGEESIVDIDVTPDGEKILYATGGDTGNTVQIVTTDSLLPANTIGNRIWLDANGNGLQDAGEMGMAGLTVHLLNNNFGIVQTVQTNAYGFYTFADLVPDTNYYVQIIPPADTYTIAPVDRGADDTRDSDFDWRDNFGTPDPTDRVLRSMRFTASASMQRDDVDAGLMQP